MEINKNIIMEIKDYDLIDGKNAYNSDTKRLTLERKSLENKKASIVAKLWKEDENGNLKVNAEIEAHQIMDLMIFLSRTIMHFMEAYKLPLLYDPENKTIERIAMQGGAMPISVCTENPNINEDIKAFSQELSNLGEFTGERIRVINRILEEMW